MLAAAVSRRAQGNGDGFDTSAGSAVCDHATGFDDLPQELLTDVASFLPFAARMVLHQVSRSAASAVEDGITSLSLSGDQALALFTGCARMPALTSLSLRDFDNHQIAEICAALANRTAAPLRLRLTDDFSRCIAPDTLAALAALSLITLTLIRPHITAEDADALSGCRFGLAVQAIGHSDLPALSAVPMLTSLALGYSVLDDGVAITLARHPHLTQLALTRTASLQGMVSLLESAFLTSLRIDHRPINAVPGDASGAQIATALAANTHLQQLALQIADANELRGLSQNQSVTALSLSTPLLTSLPLLAGMTSLHALTLKALMAPARAHCRDLAWLQQTRLRYLHLNSMRLGPGAMSVVASVPAASLLLEACGDLHADALAVLGTNVHLTTLYTRGMRLIEVTPALILLMAHAPLRSLRLSMADSKQKGTLRAAWCAAGKTPACLLLDD